MMSVIEPAYLFNRKDCLFLGSIIFMGVPTEVGAITEIAYGLLVCPEKLSLVGRPRNRSAVH